MPENPDPRKIWQETLGNLRLQMARATFELWLAGSWPLEWEPESNAWTVAVRNPYGVDWLTHQLDGVVRRTLARYTPGRPPPHVVFVAAQRQAGPPEEPEELQDPGEELEDDAGPAQEPGPPPRPEAPRAPGLAWTDLYIKIKLAFRKEALRRLKGPALSIWFCLALHMNEEGISSPGVETIMRETGLSRTTVCRGLALLCSPELRLLQKLGPRQGTDRYRLLGYAWFGGRPARTPYETAGPLPRAPKAPGPGPGL